MEIFHASHASLHSSWDRDSGEKLLITSTPTCVLLQHVNPSFVQTEASCVSLSGEEAAELCSRIRQVMAGEKGVNPDYDADNPRLIVRYTNSGDPFREGVALCLESGNYQRDFTFEMDHHIAGSVAASLRKAAAAIGLTTSCADEV